MPNNRNKNRSNKNRNRNRNRPKNKNYNQQQNNNNNTSESVTSEHEQTTELAAHAQSELAEKSAVEDQAVLGEVVAGSDDFKAQKESTDAALFGQQEETLEETNEGTREQLEEQLEASFEDEELKKSLGVTFVEPEKSETKLEERKHESKESAESEQLKFAEAVNEEEAAEETESEATSWRNCIEEREPESLIETQPNCGEQQTEINIERLKTEVEDSKDRQATEATEFVESTEMGAKHSKHKQRSRAASASPVELKKCAKLEQIATESESATPLAVPKSPPPSKHTAQLIIHRVYVEPLQEQPAAEAETEVEIVPVAVALRNNACFNEQPTQDVVDGQLPELTSAVEDYSTAIEVSDNYESESALEAQLEPLLTEASEQPLTRAQKRHAIETHFLPLYQQPPRYLDCILEEQGEGLTPSSSTSSCTKPSTSTVRQQPPEPHTRRLVGGRPLSPAERICEELIDAALAPQSENAELVYLSSSGSSSLSDLLECELEKAAALTERTLIDLDTDARALISKPAQADEAEKLLQAIAEFETKNSRESTPINKPKDAASSAASTAAINLSSTATTPSLTPSPAASSSSRSPTRSPSICSSTFTAATAAEPIANDHTAIATTFSANLCAMSDGNEQRVPANGNVNISVEPPNPCPCPNATTAAAIDRFKRQDSAESHCSDSTQHSQCTAIHNALTPPPQPPTQAQSSPSATPNNQVKKPLTDTNVNRTLSASKSEPEPAIKKLRSLCTAQLASMPYGESVLEELAQVAEQLAEQQPAAAMPYPRPTLPHIAQLQLALPKPPNRRDAWLGLTTEAKPNVLLCLSPAQRQLLAEQSKATTKPDELLAAHENYVARRGYHELTAAQVRAVEAETELLETTKLMRRLRNSLTPPPPPLPPPPVPTKSATTAAKALHANQEADVSHNGNSNSNGEWNRMHELILKNDDGDKLGSKPTTATFKPTVKPEPLHATDADVYAKMFPSWQTRDIFDEQRKRFSNFEHQLPPQEKNGHAEAADLGTRRYSNIETRSYESQRKIENGELIYDSSNSSHERQEHGDKSLIMSAAKLNGGNDATGTATATATATDATDGNKNSSKAETIAEEFGHSAKATTTAETKETKEMKKTTTTTKHTMTPLSHLNMKDFDEFSDLPWKSKSLYDLRQMPNKYLEQLKRERHAHMQELEQQIERFGRRKSTSSQGQGEGPGKEHIIAVRLESPRYTVESPSHSSGDELSRQRREASMPTADEEHFARPFGQRALPRTGIRAPRLTVSTNDLSSTRREPAGGCYSLLAREPNPTYIGTTGRRGVSPAPLSTAQQQLRTLESKELQLQLEFERVRSERQRLLHELSTTPPAAVPPTTPQTPPRQRYHSVKLPTLTEDEVFRQQMAEEWLHKVAEREDRRQHQIIKVSNINSAAEPAASEQPLRASELSDEFLDRVKARRTKLHMPADSDWESGAESQPCAGQAKTEESPPPAPLKVLDGRTEAEPRQLPPHLREFAKFSSQQEEKRGETASSEQLKESKVTSSLKKHEESTSSSKSTTIVKTYKVARLPPSVQQSQSFATVPPNEHVHAATDSTPWCRKDTTSHAQAHAQPQPPLLLQRPTGFFDELLASSPFRDTILEEFEDHRRRFEAEFNNRF